MPKKKSSMCRDQGRQVNSERDIIGKYPTKRMVKFKNALYSDVSQWRTHPERETKCFERRQRGKQYSPVQTTHLPIKHTTIPHHKNHLLTNLLLQIKTLESIPDLFNSSFESTGKNLTKRGTQLNEEVVSKHKEGSVDPLTFLTESEQVVNSLKLWANISIWCVRGFESEDNNNIHCLHNLFWKFIRHDLL